MLPGHVFQSWSPCHTDNTLLQRTLMSNSHTNHTACRQLHFLLEVGASVACKRGLRADLPSHLVWWGTRPRTRNTLTSSNCRDSRRRLTFPCASTQHPCIRHGTRVVLSLFEGDMLPKYRASSPLAAIEGSSSLSARCETANKTGLTDASPNKTKDKWRAPWNTRVKDVMIVFSVHKNYCVHVDSLKVFKAKNPQLRFICRASKGRFVTLECQLVATQFSSAVRCCRLLGLPPHKQTRPASPELST